MKKTFGSFTDITSLVRHNQQATLLTLVLLSATVRVFWLLFSDNCVDGDAPARLFAGVQWARHPVLLPDLYWLPGHYYFTGIILRAFHEMPYSARIAHLILGIITIIPFYLATKAEFGERVALYSGVVLALLPSHTELSSLTLAEPVFIFFLFTGFYLCTKYVQTLKIKYLLAGGLAIACMDLLRYEGWIITAAMTGWLWIRTPAQNRKFLPVFVLIVATVPAGIMLNAYLTTGDALASITISNVEVFSKNKEQVSLPLMLLFCFGAFPLYLLFFLPIGIAISIKKQVANGWWLIFLLPCACTLYKVLNGSLTANTRYFIPYAVLSIPLMVYGALHVLPSKKEVKLFMLGLTIVYFAIGAFVNLNNEFARFEPGFKGAIAYTKQNLLGKRILIGTPVKMNMEQAFFTQTNACLLPDTAITKPEILFFDTRQYVTNDTVNETCLDSVIEQYDIEYLVLCKNGALRKSLGFCNPNEQLAQHNFELVFNQQDYFIYQISEQ